MKSAGEPPSAGEWVALLSASTIPVRELERAQVPDEPGVYLWRHEGQAVYVGIASSLRGRAGPSTSASASASPDPRYDGTCASCYSGFRRTSLAGGLSTR